MNDLLEPASAALDCPPLTESALPLITADDARSAAKGISRFSALVAFLRNMTCSRTLMTVVDREYGHLLTLEERAADPLAGGLMRGHQCGMLWGSTLATGAQAFQLHGPGPRAEAVAVAVAQQIVASFYARHQTINCREITGADPQDSWQSFKYFFLKGGFFACCARVSGYAPEALRTIDAALSAEPADPSPQPRSCAALLARRLGASEQQATMAAGLAGGIGLSGGACGALGTALWLCTMKDVDVNARPKLVLEKVNEQLDRLCAGFGDQLECAAIVGRRFVSGDDHARYLCDGGCAALIEQLAATAASL